MLSLRLSLASAALLAATLLLPRTGAAQLNSNTQTVTLNATLAESLTIAASPSAVSFTLVSGGTAVASAPVSIVSTWVLTAGRATVKLYGWFTTPAAALTDGATIPNNIPSSEVLGQVSSATPTSYTAFTQTNTLGAAGGGLLLYAQALSATNRNSNRTDALNLEINLAAQPQLPAGSYTGTLTLQAQAL